MSEIAGLYEIRAYQDSDRAFVKATFLRGLYHGDSWFSLIPRDEFMKAYSRIADQLIDSPNTKIKIACLKEDHDVILGYSILNTAEDTLHWVYVKKGEDKDLSWRRNGVASQLIGEKVSVVTHLSSLGLMILRNKHPTWTFNPFAVGV